MGGFNHGHANRFAVHWRPDPDYRTQVNWARQMPCLLVVELSRGPDVMIEPRARVHFVPRLRARPRQQRPRAARAGAAPDVPYSGAVGHREPVDPARRQHRRGRGAARGRPSRGMRVRDGQPQLLAAGSTWRTAASQTSPSSPLWSATPGSKGIQLGGYSLLSSRRIGGGNDVVSPPGERPTHGNCPALTSPWGQQYFTALRAFFRAHPGSCSSPTTAPIPGTSTSRRARRCSAAWVIRSGCSGRSLPASTRRSARAASTCGSPTTTIWPGANECGMGYRETNWSLPRAQQVVHTRQNIYDGTWEKTPSMGWMFVPLTQYHGGGRRGDDRAARSSTSTTTAACSTATWDSGCRRSTAATGCTTRRACVISVRGRVAWFKRVPRHPRERCDPRSPA